jgi:putative flippase GtrA
LNFASLARFAVVSGFGTAAHYALLIALVEFGGANPVPATVAGSILGALVNYTLSRQHVFRSDRSHREALPRFLAVAGVGMSVNALLMAGFTRWLGLPYLLAQVITTLLLLLWHYGANALWTFRGHRR